MAGACVAGAYAWQGVCVAPGGGGLVHGRRE